MNHLRFQNSVFLVALAAAVALLVAIIWPFWKALIWAGMLTVLVYPINQRLRRWISPTGAAAACCVLVIVVLLLPTLYIGTLALDEGTRLAQEIPRLIDRNQFIQNFPVERFQALYRRFERYAGAQKLDPRDALQDNVKQAVGYVSGRLTASIKNVAWLLFQTALTFVAMFFALRDGSRILPGVRTLIPLDDEQTRLVERVAANTIRAILYGSLVVAALQGTLGGITFWALGLDAPVLLGTLMAALCLVPFLGPPAVWLPVALFLLLEGEFVKALILTVIAMLVIGVVDNIVRPLVVGGQTRQHPLPIFLAIIGGIVMFGPVGLILGPVVLSVTIALIEILRRKLEQDRAGLPHDAMPVAAADDAPIPVAKPQGA